MKKKPKPSGRIGYWAREVYCAANNVEGFAAGGRHLGLAVQAGLCWPGQRPGQKTRREALKAMRELKELAVKVRYQCDQLTQTIDKLDAVRKEDRYDR